MNMHTAYTQQQAEQHRKSLCSTGSHREAEWRMHSVAQQWRVYTGQPQVEVYPRKKQILSKLGTEDLMS